MAGYFTKLNGYVYSGEYKVAAGKTVKNGTFVVPNAAELTAQNPTSAVNGYIFKCVEKTTVYGLPALRLDVVKVVNDGTEAYFVENVFNPLCYNFDQADQTIGAGEYLRMHMPELGDQLLMSVDDTLYASAAVGSKYKIGADGLLVANS